MLDAIVGFIASSRKLRMVASVVTLVGMAGYASYELVKEIREWKTEESGKEER